MTKTPPLLLLGPPVFVPDAARLIISMRLEMRQRFEGLEAQIAGLTHCLTDVLAAQAAPIPPSGAPAKDGAGEDGAGEDGTETR